MAMTATMEATIIDLRFRSRRWRVPRVAVLGGVLVIQALCAVLFSFNILSALLGLPAFSWQVYELVEIGAALGLVVGTVLAGVLLLQAQRKAHAAEQSLRAASGAFMGVVEDRFEGWELTPAERDVALFLIKGMSTSEIADLRQTSQGTIKAQTNAIYRKSGVAGRAQLLSLFIDDLLEDPLLPG